MKSNFVSDLFTNKPGSWGLRGDPYLWDELEERTKAIKLPNNQRELQVLLHDLFEDLTGQKLQEGQNIFVKRHSLGGMSSGTVCCDFWIKSGFQIVFDEYKRLNESL